MFWLIQLTRRKIRSVSEFNTCIEKLKSHGELAISRNQWKCNCYHQFLPTAIETVLANYGQWNLQVAQSLSFYISISCLPHPLLALAPLITFFILPPWPGAKILEKKSQVISMATLLAIESHCNSPVPIKQEKRISTWKPNHSSIACTIIHLSILDSFNKNKNPVNFQCTEILGYRFPGVPAKEFSIRSF